MQNTQKMNIIAILQVCYTCVTIALKVLTFC